MTANRKFHSIAAWMVVACLGLSGVLVMLTSCSRPADDTLPPPNLSVLGYTPTPVATMTLAPTASSTVNPFETQTPTLSPTPTQDPYTQYFLDTLAERKYGGGVLEDTGDLPANGAFKRKLFKYRSEGLDLYGFITIPEGEGPFPIVIMLHGFVEPAQYNTLGYTVRYADALAEAGYYVVNPNLRGYAPSPAAPNAFGIGDTVDVMNLISLLRTQAGAAGLVQKADAGRIGLWGHSMGGGIVLRVMILDPDIKAGVLYGSIHYDEAENLSHFEKDGRGFDRVVPPDEALKKISPLEYLKKIDAPLSIHHGEMDVVVPVEWSRDLCRQLEELKKQVTCVFYPDQPHTFKNAGDTRFIYETGKFFDTVLKEAQ